MTTIEPKNHVKLLNKKNKNQKLANSSNNFSVSSNNSKMIKSNLHLPKLNYNEHYKPKINFEELDLDKLVNKEVFLKAYYKARRKMIVSKHLDEDFRNRLGILKYENYEKRELIYPKKPKLKKELSWFNDLYHKYGENENRSSSMDDDDDDSINTFKIDWTQLSKEKLSNSNRTTLPPIRFGSTLSKDAQFALMKSLEDQIVREIEINCPELVNKVPRTTTAQYSKKHKPSNPFKSNDNNSISCHSSENSSTNRSRLSIINTSSFNDKNGENNNYEVSEFFSNDDNFGFLDRNLNVNNKQSTISSSTNETNRNEDIEVEMIKKLVITEQINSAMDILDNIRKVGKPKKQFHKKIQFDSKLIDQMKFGPSNNKFNFKSTNSSKSSLKTAALPPIKMTRPSSRSTKTERPESKLTKFEPNLVKYNEWKSQWFNQLHNI